MTPPSDTDDLASALADAATDAPAPKAGGDADADAMAAEWEAMLGGAEEGGDEICRLVLLFGRRRWACCGRGLSLRLHPLGEPEIVRLQPGDALLCLGELRRFVRS